jgi:hypothetical protein
MIHFLRIVIQEKSYGEDYRAFLEFADSDTMTVYQIRGYGATPGNAADNAYSKYDSDDREMNVQDEWEWK